MVKLVLHDIYVTGLSHLTRKADPHTEKPQGLKMEDKMVCIKNKKADPKNFNLIIMGSVETGSKYVQRHVR